MALVVPSSRRLQNHCIFGAVVPFDACLTYRSPCSPDASIDDGWFICDYHLRLRFKMAKMVLPIFDEDYNRYKRTIARHLVGHKEMGDKRVLVPTAGNYENVLRINTMMQSEQLIFHLIYNDTAKVQEICNLLKHSETYFDNTYSMIEDVYSRTRNILALTDPQAFCSRVSTDEDRYFDTIAARNAPGRAALPAARSAEANTIFQAFPGFLQNLIRRAVAPEILQIDGEELRLRNCATCQITAEGLIATTVDGPQLYNPVQNSDIIKNKPNRLQVRNVLKFEGDTRTLERTLARYEEYPTFVPLFLGYQLINSENSVLRANNFIPAVQFGTAAPTLPATTGVGAGAGAEAGVLGAAV
ncbi:VP39 [Parapoynx stagnalis nucleopolyhedrovirus]|uniref:VP39 n=1 Tax=Parapoynx stagnalis nucleopolyhedrovirus TaxID=2993413 RepID=A0A9E8BW16_9ABAC|nr:VP39 [Parapoynx stagnalis nucleopolyhedrovirus]